MSYSGAATPGSVPYSISLSLATGVDYRIYISAGAEDYGLTGSVSATLDPIFTITDPNAQDYQLVFNDGINNGAISATPLPAALPLFSTGVGANRFARLAQEAKSSSGRGLSKQINLGGQERAAGAAPFICGWPLPSL